MSFLAYFRAISLYATTTASATLSPTNAVTAPDDSASESHLRQRLFLKYQPWSHLEQSTPR